MGTSKKVDASTVNSGGPLPGEENASAPAGAVEVSAPLDTPNSAPERKFGRLSSEEDPYQRGFKRFEVPGDTFVGKFVRAIAPGEQGLDNAALEFVDDDGNPWLLPGNQQLWEFFVDKLPANDPRRGRSWEIALVERVMDKDGKPKFVRYRIRPEEV